MTRKKSHRKSILLFSLLAGVFFLLGVTKEYHWPMIKTVTLVELENFSEENLPVKILANDLKVGLWPPAISLEKVRLQPKKDLASKLGPIQLDAVAISFGRMNPVSGNFHLGKVTIDRPVINVILKADRKPQSKPNSKKQAAIDFEKLFSIPLSQIEINDMQLQLRVDEEDLALKMEEVDLAIELSDPDLDVRLETPKITAKKTGKNPSLTAAVLTDFSLSPKLLEINTVRVKKGKSSFIGSGQITGELSQQRRLSYDLKSRTYLDLPALKSWIQETFPKIKLPRLKGEVMAQATFVKKGPKKADIGFSLSSLGLKIDDIFIGHLQSKGSTDLKNISVDKLQVKNRSGFYNINKFALSTKSNFDFSGNVSVRKMRLAKFLVNLGLKEPNLRLQLNGDLPCKGQVKPEFKLECNGSLSGKDLYVGGNPKPIVEVDNLTAKGSVSVDSKEVRYKAQMTAFAHDRKKYPSEGGSEGVINYQDGFNIKFFSNRLALKNVKSLAGINLKGSTKINGYTKGNSSSAIISSQFNTKNFRIENFFVDNMRTLFTYKKGVLGFQNISGNAQKTVYRGYTSIDLINNKLDSQIEFDDLYANDLRNILIGKIQIPFSMNGNGSGRAKVWGPLVLNQLSYRADLNLSRGSIGPESFNQLYLDVESDRGRSKINRFEIIKGQKANSASFKITGAGQPDGNIKGQIIARKIRLEESELAQTMGFNIKSGLNFNIDVDGFYLSPNARMSGIFSDMFIADYKLPPSEFNLYISQDSLSGKINFFDKTLIGDFIFPLNKNSPFSLKAEINDWDFIPIFGFLHPTVKSLNYNSNLSASIQLSSEKDGFWNSTGNIAISNLMLKRGEAELRSKNKMLVSFKNGIINSKNFELTGANSFLKAEMKNSSENDLRTTTSAKMDLSLLAFLSPTVEDIKGPSSISFQIGGPRKKPQILGSAFVDGGYIKFKDFPHPIEKIKADLLISQSKLLINSIFANVAKGNIYANGHIGFTENSAQDNTKIQLTAENIEIDYPKGVRTKFSGKTLLSGAELPFKLEGDIVIDESEIAQEFDKLKPKSISVTANPFLPKVFQETAKNPLVLDLNINVKDKVEVNNSLMRANFTGAIKVSGDPLDPKVVGKFNSLPNGILKVQKTPFELEQAFLQFRGLVPMDPLLYAKALGRKEEFDIQFFLQGPLSTAQDDIQLTSNPELEKEAIVRLLAFGVTGETDDQQAIGQVGTIVGDRLIPPEWKEKFGLGVVYDQEGSQEDIERRFGIQGRLGEKIGIRATRDAERDNSTEVRAEYEWNKNFSTILSWEESSSSDTSSVIDTEDPQEDRLGLDVELKFNF